MNTLAHRVASSPIASIDQRLIELIAVAGMAPWLHSRLTI
jgi:hypothetical protein